MQAAGELPNAHGVYWHELRTGQHAVVDAGGSSGLLGVVGEKVLLPSCISSSSSALLCCCCCCCGCTIPKNTRAAPDLRSHVDAAVVLILGGLGMRAC